MGPHWVGGGSGLVLGPAAAQIGRHRDIDQFRVSKPHVLHIAGEITDGDVAPEARVEAALLGDAGCRKATVIVRRVEQAVIRKAEDPVMDRAIHRRRVALLEIGAAAAADQQAITGKGHAVVVEQ
jgi:hypothetical protein